MRTLTVTTVVLLASALAAPAQDEKKRPAGAEVEIKGMKYEPAEVRIKAGQTVTWTNRDDRDHTVNSDDGKTFQSGNIKRGRTFQQKFPKAGKFPYSCSYHPRMKGLVIVE